MRQGNQKLSHTDRATGASMQVSRTCLNRGGNLPNLLRKESASLWRPQRRERRPLDQPKPEQELATAKPKTQGHPPGEHDQRQQCCSRYVGKRDQVWVQPAWWRRWNKWDGGPGVACQETWGQIAIPSREQLQEIADASIQVEACRTRPEKRQEKCYPHPP